MTPVLSVSREVVAAAVAHAVAAPLFPEAAAVAVLLELHVHEPGGLHTKPAVLVVSLVVAVAQTEAPLVVPLFLAEAVVRELLDAVVEALLVLEKEAVPKVLEELEVLGMAMAMALARAADVEVQPAEPT